MIKYDQRKLLMFSFFLFFFFIPVFIFAENEKEYAIVASPFEVDGVANNHDIISYSSEQKTYSVSKIFADEAMFGVIVDDPVLYMESETIQSEKVRPIVRYGETIVNVSDIGGDIVAGDIITTSQIPGFGQKTNRQNATYILGFALKEMTPNGNFIETGEKRILLGTVPITLHMGPFLTKEGADFVAFGGKNFEDLISKIVNDSNSNTSSDTNKDVDVFKIFRYFLATIITISSIIVSMNRFSDTFKESVVSIGRNPLARSQIRSVLVWNILSSVLISGAGIGVATAIIFIP